MQKIMGYILFVAVLFLTSAWFSYTQMRDSVQQTTVEILMENEHGEYKAVGISLPLSAAFSSGATAKVFLQRNGVVDKLKGGGEVKIIEVEVTSMGIPIISAFTGTEYWVEISGLELMKLKL